MAKGRKQGTGRTEFAHSGELVVLLRNRERAARTFEASSCAIASAWLMLGEAQGKRKQEVFRLLTQTFGALKDSSLWQFYQAVTDENQPHDVLRRFLGEVCSEGIVATGLTLHRTGDEVLSGRVARKLFASGNPHFGEALQVADRQYKQEAQIGRRGVISEKAGELDALCLLVGSSLLVHEVPLPRFSGRGKRSFVIGDILVVEGGPTEQGAELVREQLVDPKGNWRLSSIPWKLASGAEAKIAGRLLESVAAAYVMPSEAKMAIKEAVADPAMVLEELETTWGKVTASSPRQWVPSEGLMELELKIGGYGVADTGVEKAILYSAGFPAMEVGLVVSVFAGEIEERSPIRPDGTLDFLDHHLVGSPQWELRVLVNRAVVRWLCELTLGNEAGCPPSSGKQARPSGKGDDTSEPEAIIPRFFRIGRRGKEPSDEAVERAIRWKLGEPLSGMTFHASPSIEAERKAERDAAGRPLKLRPRVRVVEII